MLESARIILGPFPKTILFENSTHQVITVRKVSVCYYGIIDKTTKRKYVYKKTVSFERALRKHNIDRAALESNIKEILFNNIDSLLKDDIGKDDIDFFAIKKVLFTPNKSILIGQTKLRSLILKNTEDNNYFEMLYYVQNKNRKILTARTEIGCTEIVKAAKRENIHMDSIIKNIQFLMIDKYNSMQSQESQQLKN